MHIVTGPVGSGTCDSAHPCSIAVNNASSLTGIEHENPFDHPCSSRSLRDYLQGSVDDN